MPTTHHGYILIADITGYTAYLSESELEHASQTLSALLNLLIDHTRPPLVISRTAGDAVISYGLQDHFLQGQAFVELIEETYVAFRQAIDLMVLNTSCQCNACKNIGKLDLKFFIHYGSFGLQKLGATEEMVGTDVNLVHRLLKNTVTEKTGHRAYALYTDAAIRQLGLEEICKTMQSHAESYEHIGTVPVWVQDMHPVWEGKKDQVEIQIPPEKELMRVAAVIPVSPEVLWDYLIRPEHLNVFLAATKTTAHGQVDGRISIGSEFRCYHGDSYVALTILAWRPFKRILVTSELPIPVKGVSMLTELVLEAVDGGTRFMQVFGKTEGPLHGRLLANLAYRGMLKQAQRDIDNFGDHIAEQVTVTPPGDSHTPR